MKKRHRNKKRIVQFNLPPVIPETHELGTNAIPPRPSSSNLAELVSDLDRMLKSAWDTYKIEPTYYYLSEKNCRSLAEYNRHRPLTDAEFSEWLDKNTTLVHVPKIGYIRRIP